MDDVISIDFGTSMSKVAVKINGVLAAIPLGELSGDPVKKYPYESSLLFSSDGSIYLGYEAVKKSLEHAGGLEPRLDSLKRRLTTGAIADLSEIKIPAEFNQTGVPFSIRDALTLLIGHLLALSRKELKNSFDRELDDTIEIRFTRPVFDTKRAAWVDREMSHAINAAYVLQESLRKPHTGFIAAQKARELLTKAINFSGPHVLPGIEEPVAASVLYLSQPNRRSISAIVDIGAGTTDLGLFVAIQPDRAEQIDRARALAEPKSVNKAGDHLDKILKAMLIDGNQTDAQGRIEIDLSIRRWKEDLFTFNEAVATLSRGRILRRVLRHQFLAQQEYVGMANEIREALQSMLDSAVGIEMFANASYHTVNYIDLIPAGGGARLPLIDELAKLFWQGARNVLPLRVVREVPDIALDYSDDFPQLAVALGAADAENPTFVRRAQGGSRVRVC